MGGCFILPLIVKYGLAAEGQIVINLFKRDTKNTAKVVEKRERQEERRQKAQARGQKPIK
jgi:hypothetical protein